MQQSNVKNHLCTQTNILFLFLLLQYTRRARAHSVCTHTHFFSGVLMHGNARAIKKYVTRTYKTLSLVHITLIAHMQQSNDNNYVHTNILYSFFVVKVYTARACAFCLHAHTFLFWCSNARRAHARYKKICNTYIQNIIIGTHYINSTHAAKQ